MIAAPDTGDVTVLDHVALPPRPDDRTAGPSRSIDTAGDVAADEGGVALLGVGDVTVHDRPFAPLGEQGGALADPDVTHEPRFVVGGPSDAQPVDAQPVDAQAVFDPPGPPSGFLLDDDYPEAPEWAQGPSPWSRQASHTDPAIASPTWSTIAHRAWQAVRRRGARVGRMARRMRRGETDPVSRPEVVVRIEGRRGRGRLSARRYAIAGGLALLVAAVAVVAVVILVRDPAEKPPISDLAAKALALYEGGDVAGALAVLTAGDLTGDPDAHRILGYVHTAADRTGDALAAYRAAVALDRQQFRDVTLRSQLIAVFDRPAGDHVPEALAVLRAALKPPEGAALSMLIDLASAHPVLDTRHQAFALAEELGHGARIDRLASYTLDLRQERRCKARRRAVVALRELGDQRAIPALRLARQGRGLESTARGNNRCLRRAAKRAIEHLEKVPDAAPARPGESPVSRTGESPGESDRAGGSAGIDR